jgi:cytidine deaminase
MSHPFDADALLAQAREARDHAYAPYSHFKVGAALLTSEGVIIQGCNVENASYGLTNCAERTAIFTAVARGLRSFRAIAIVASGPPPSSPTGAAPCTPCGACRQVLSEFSPTMEVVLEQEDGSAWLVPAHELLPHQFVLQVDSSYVSAE